MRYIINDLKTMRKEKIVTITVWDSFEGEVKILKNRLYKWFVEIIDVSMCYPQLVPYRQGEKTWVYRSELFREPKETKLSEDVLGGLQDLPY